MVATLPIADDELLIFVGHSRDGSTAASAVKALESQVQEELRLLDEASGHKSSFRRVKIYEWSEDAPPDVGGQNTIDPIIERANIAVFIFQDRAGRVTWDELEKCRLTKTPTIAVFARNPSTDGWNDASFLKDRADLLNKKASLVQDWTDRDSSSLRPILDFESIDELTALVFKQIKLVLPRFILGDQETPSTRKATGPFGSTPQVYSKDELEMLFASIHSEHRPCGNATIADLDSELLVECWKRIRRATTEVPELPLIIEDLGVLAPFPPNNRRLVHKAAVLCFCPAPEKYIPQARSSIVMSTVGQIRQDTFRGSISRQLEQLMQACRELSQDHEFIDENGIRRTRSATSSSLIRELFSNALVHRDYDTSGKVEVEVTARHIEVRSPGLFPRGISWDRLLAEDVKGSSPRNPAIALYLYGLGAVEEIGRGADIIRAHIRSKGSESIEFRESANAKVVVRVRREVLDPPSTATAVKAALPDIVSEAATGLDPAYPDEATRELSEALDILYQQRADLTSEGLETTDLDAQIRDYKRRLRKDPHLKEGDFLSDGRYRLLSMLGQGGFAQVWKAYDRQRRSLVAVKVLHSQYGRDHSRRARFFRGARQMAQLADLPGIVNVFEQECQDDGFHFFVMEYVSGGDFRQAVLKGRLSKDERLGMILEVGRALQVAHDRGIVHRDVKPANILLDSKNRPKLTDFDLVRAADTTGGTRTSKMGTFVYAAPEAMIDAGGASAPADVYGLGMTAVFALYGADLPAEAFFELREFMDQLEIRDELREVVIRGVARKIEKRFATVDAFCDALERVM